jgi:prepilin-type N-terminal cleavage/methylation domain-containing protein
MKRGFSLVEMIAVLLLLAVLGVSAFISLIPMTEAMMQSRTAVGSVHKINLAGERLSSEFLTITNVAAGGSRFITFDFLDPNGRTTRHAVSWSGVPGESLMLEGIPLSDDVRSFELRYYADPDATAQSQWFSDARLIEIVLHSLRSEWCYTNRVVPRNLSRIGG